MSWWGPHEETCFCVRFLLLTCINIISILHIYIYIYIYIIHIYHIFWILRLYKYISGPTDKYFSEGLKPPTRYMLHIISLCFFCLFSDFLSPGLLQDLSKVSRGHLKLRSKNAKVKSCSWPTSTPQKLR